MLNTPKNSVFMQKSTLSVWAESTKVVSKCRIQEVQRFLSCSMSSLSASTETRTDAEVSSLIV